MKTIVLIDGGYLRVKVKSANKSFNANYVERFALACVLPTETLVRVLFYDCSLYTGTATLPVSGTTITFRDADNFLQKLEQKDLFAVRKGVLKFRGYKPRNTPILNPGAPLTDADFKPDFEQKGVDMRIGLDIASYSHDRLVDRIVLVSNDTDCVPAMKCARKAGLQTVIVQLPNGPCAKELVAHSDFKRDIIWP